MSEIDKVTRLLELATLYRLREEFDLKAPVASETRKPRGRARQEAEPVADKESTEPVGA